MIRLKLLAVPAALVMLSVSLGASATAQSKPSSDCNASCLTAVMEDFLAKTTAHQTGSIKVAPDAMIYVNTHPVRLDEIPLTRVKEIKSKQIFADAVTGNVLAHTGLEMEDGRITYAGTRLKIVGQTITQVEVSFDDSKRVVASYVTFLDPLMTTIVPPDQRQSRAELKAIIERYFQSLTDHVGIPADYDDRCDRYHSGQRVTNNPRNSVEGPPMPPPGSGPAPGSVPQGGGTPSSGSAPPPGAVPPRGPMPPMTCFTSINGPRPWGPATDIRIPIVDPEHGIVLGYTLLLYKNDNAPMYVSEVFKILDGKIRMIDNIGLKAEGMQDVHFPE